MRMAACALRCSPFHPASGICSPIWKVCWLSCPRYHNDHTTSGTLSLRPPESAGLVQRLFSSGVWGGRVPTPKGYPAPPQMILSGGCGAAKPHHNHQKKECARDTVPRAPKFAFALLCACHVLTIISVVQCEGLAQVWAGPWQRSEHGGARTCAILRSSARRWISARAGVE